ncbi:hypothetical protein [uncultured Mediterranean phage]|nr:hypothetical protein [uncultured Mediterranean phage]
MSILQSVVNTNISSVTDPNSARGNPSQGVMAFECGASSTVGTADVQAIADTVLIAGSETVGAYQGTLLAGLAAAAGVQQTVTMTFANDHNWTAATHDIEVQLVGAAADAANLDTGHCNGGSFGTSKTLEFQRRAGQAITNSQLQACTFLVTVRERGVAKV